MKFIATTWGRRVYGTYLITAMPLFCVTSAIVFLLLTASSAPLNEPPAEEFPNTWPFNLGFLSCLVFLLVWATSLLTAHRLDRPGWRTIPFGLNLLPVSALLVSIGAGAVDEDTGMMLIGILAYLAVLVLILAAGIVLAILHHDAPAEEEGMPN